MAIHDTKPRFQVTQDLEATLNVLPHWSVLKALGYEFWSYNMCIHVDLRFCTPALLNFYPYLYYSDRSDPPRAGPFDFHGKAADLEAVGSADGG